jgi:hypothetical protein
VNRTPPASVRRMLRQEVGFGCPIPGCGSPYLTWHHFDPPWNVHPHHDPRGMIALCPDHHARADKRTWTKEQLRGFKRRPKGERQQVKGRFEWMRDQLLAVAGGNVFYETPILLYYSQQPVIWFKRDAQGYLKVNLRRPLTEREADAVMEDNDWVVPGDVADIECPPAGHLLAVRYPNGDSLRVEFREMTSAEEAARRLPAVAGLLADLAYPLATVDFQVKIPALGLDIGSETMRVPGEGTVQGCLWDGCAIAIALGPVPHDGAAVHLE